MVARVVPQSARRRHAESRKPDLWGGSAGGRWPVLWGFLTPKLQSEELVGLESVTLLRPSQFANALLRPA